MTVANCYPHAGRSNLVPGLVPPPPQTRPAAGTPQMRRPSLPSRCPAPGPHRTPAPLRSCWKRRRVWCQRGRPPVHTLLPEGPAVSGSERETPASGKVLTYALQACPQKHANKSILRVSSEHADGRNGEILQGTFLMFLHCL